MKKSTHKRLVAWLLTLALVVMLLSLLPTTALAAGPASSVRVYNGRGTFTSLSDGECLTANNAEGASSYTGGAYVARYEASSGTLYLNGYQNDLQIIAPESVIFADGDLNIEVVSDSSFSTSVSASDDLYGIQANGKLNITGSGKLTVTAKGDGTVYGIHADKGVTISAPLNVQVGKVDSSKNGPLYGIYTKSGAITLSGNDMTVAATDARENVYGVYNAAGTFTTITENDNITISGNLTVDLSNDKYDKNIYKYNRGISSQGGVITLEGATVKISGNYRYGIFNSNGNVVITSKSDVDISSNISDNNGICTYSGGDLTIQNSAVKVSAKGPAAFLEGNVSIQDSKVELTSTYKHHEVIRTGNSSTANTIDLSGSGSVTLTASGEQTNAMINGTVSLVGNTKCETGHEDNNTYGGEYDKAKDITVLQFVHKDPAPTTNISVSGTIKSYNLNNATTIQLMQGSMEKYKTTIDPASGSSQMAQDFTFDAVAKGTYDLVVTKPGHLTYTVKNVVVGSTDLDLTAMEGKPYQTITLLCGDIVKNGYIDFADYQELLSPANYGKKTTDTGVNALADLNGNGYIDFADYQILLSSQHYGKSAVLVNFGE